MSKLSLAIAVAMLAVSALASTAEARGSGNFYASPFFRNQGRPQQQDTQQYDSANQERAKAAYARERARELAAARERAAAAEHARLLALKQKPKTDDTVADKPAPKGDALTSTTVPKGDATTPDTVKKADLDSSAPASTTTSSTDTVQPAAQTQTCRKYSAATGGLVETACQ